MKLPFVIGVTGHRDIDPQSIDRVESEVRRLIRAIQEKSAVTPLVFLSSLADGADRLVARIAIEAGHDVMAILPKPISTFRGELQDPSDFDRILACCRTTILADQSDNPYVNAAKEIARLSHVVLALWDGIDISSEQPGGTAYSVILRKGRQANALLKEIFVMKGPWLWIDTPRARPAPSQHSQEASPSLDQVTLSLLATLDKVNRDLEYRQIKLTSMDTIDSMYLHADLVANAMQRRSRRYHLGLLVFAALAFLFQQIGQLTDQTWLTTGSILAIVIVILMSAAGKHGKIHDRYLTLRLMGEILRIRRIFPSVLTSSSHGPLAQQRESLIWLLRSVEALSLLESITQVDSSEEMTKAWLTEQLAYFTKASDQAGRMKKATHRSSLVLYLSALLFALVVKWGGLSGSIITFLPSAAILLAVLVDHHSRLRAYAEDYSRYATLKGIFADACALWPFQSSQSRSEIGITLAREFIAELGFWYQTHKERPLETAKI